MQKFTAVMVPRIFENRNLVLLWIGHIISHGGDAIYQIALPWLVLELTGSKTTTSLVAVSAYLPAVLFSLFSGVLVDRFDRRRVMMFSDGARMLLIALLAVYLLKGGTSPVVLGIIAFLVATFATLFYPARDALVPDLVTPDRLTTANAFISTSGQFAHLAGPVLAAALRQRVSRNQSRGKKSNLLNPAIFTSPRARVRNWTPRHLHLHGLDQ